MGKLSRFNVSSPTLIGAVLIFGMILPLPVLAGVVLSWTDGHQPAAGPSVDFVYDFGTAATAVDGGTIYLNYNPVAASMSQAQAVNVPYDETDMYAVVQLAHTGATGAVSFNRTLLKARDDTDFVTAAERGEMWFAIKSDSNGGGDQRTAALFFFQDFDVPVNPGDTISSMSLGSRNLTGDDPVSLRMAVHAGAKWYLSQSAGTAAGTFITDDSEQWAEFTPSTAASTHLMTGAGLTYNVANAAITSIDKVGFLFETASLSSTTRAQLQLENFTVSVATNETASLPPFFLSDPVSKVDAIQDEAYTGTILDDASDPNGDTLFFAEESGPSWLTVATNGTLSGTPLAGDQGTNQWLVSVTDGISGTNTATLQIHVMPPPPTPQTSQTNFVFFVIDDLGWMDLSVQGSQFYETPRIDQLAQSGMRFTQGYSPHPRCTAARYGFMTGHFPGANGVPGGSENSLRPWDTTLAESFKAHGYATFFAGKWHLIGSHGADNLPQNQGFDTNIAGGKAGLPPTYFYPYRIEGTPEPTDELSANALYFEEEGVAGEYVTDRITDESIEWLTWNADQPFFMCVWHYGVHGPFEAPAALISKYETKLTSMDYGDLADLPERIPYGVGEQKTRQDFPTYAAMVESMDTNVGRLLDKLDELGIASNTIVVFTSDNGGLSNEGGYRERTLATSNYPLRTGKGWLYEGGIREAFIVRGPGVTPMVNSNAVVVGTDIYPTLLDLAGFPLQPSDHVDGISFKTALSGGAYDRGEPIFWHSPLGRPYSTGDFNSSAVRDGDYKLIWWYDTPGKNYELYNIRTDIGEHHDLSDILPAKAAELLGKIQAWHAGAHEGSGVVIQVDDDDVSKPPKHILDDPTVPVSIAADGTTLELSWLNYLGFDFQILSKTNLLDETWTLENSAIMTNGISFPMDGHKGFYKVEFLLQSEN